MPRDVPQGLLRAAVEERLDLRRQLRSDRFAVLAELIERATERPVIEFTLPSGLRGIEYAEEARRSDEVH